MRVQRTYILALVLIMFGNGLSYAQTSRTLREDLEYARQKIYPCLVNIAVITKSYSLGRTVRFPVAGSGVVVSPAGHVVSNYHVCENAVRIVCTLPTGEAIPAEVIAYDPPSDLCVLKLRLDTRRDASVPLPFATLGDSGALSVGEYVIAVGNPLTLSSSMTLGIVSNPRRVFTDFTGTNIEDLEFSTGNRTGMFTQWIQHDALILPGNSGGPLINLRGEIVGINTRGGSGVGFATPSTLVASVVNQILSFGEVRRGWLGFSIMPVNKLGRDRGALVASVVPSSPADKAGLIPGDFILSLDNEPVVIKFFEELPRLYQRIATMVAGEKIDILIQRVGEEKTLTATVGPMEKYVGREVEVRQVGITVQDITGPMALARRYPDDNGVVITSLRPGQPFENARPRFLPGDVVVSLDGKPLKDLDSFLDSIEKSAAKKELSVGYRRERENILAVVKLEREKPRKPGGELPKAWLGVRTQVLTPMVAKALGVEGTRGFRVTEVLPWSAASIAGIQRGDIITAIEDEKLEAFRPQDSKDLQRVIEEFSVGEEVELAILRDGKPEKIGVELGETPASAIDVKKEKNEVIELTVREITFMDKIKYYWDKDQQGVIVVECTSGGWADIGGLLTNDLITRINNQSVTDLKTFKSTLDSIIEKQPSVIQVFVRRGYRTTFVFIEPDWEKSGAAK